MEKMMTQSKQIQKTGIPAGWRTVKLGEVVKLNYGKSLPEHKRIDGNIPVYSSAGLTGWHNKALVNEIGLIVGRKGTIGTVYKSEKPFYPIDTVFYISENETDDDLNYLFYKLSAMGLSYLNSDSAVPGLNRNTAHEQQILLPSLSEQKAIAEVLSSLDDKIDLFHRQNITLEAMAQVLFRKWFVDNPERERWAVRKLGDEFDFTMGQSPPGVSYNEDKNGVPMFQGNADFGSRFPKNRIYTTEPKRFAEKFDTLISIRAPVGEQNMAKEKCCIGRGVAAFRYKKDRNFYTYTYFKMMSLMDEVKQFNQEGTVFGSISKGDFENINILIPSIERTRKFQELARPIDDKIILNNKQISTLENLRDTLLPKLMSGKVRVKEA